MLMCHMFTEEKIRLNKFISSSGFCSRREADQFIEDKKVTINGKTASSGDKVSTTDTVKVGNQVITPKEKERFIVIALNKPVGIVSTTESAEKDNIVDFIGHPQRIFPIGRLDKDSQGLIFLTNNGDIVNKILRAGNNHEKEYIVTVDKPVTDNFIKGMSGGVPILGQVTKKCKITKESERSFRITLIQGLNRQIRRMAEYFGYEVLKLERIRIMNVSLGKLPVGDWRDLTDEEMKTLEKLIKSSSSDSHKSTSTKKQAKKPQQQQKKKSKFDKLNIPGLEPGPGGKNKPGKNMQRRKRR